MPGYLKHDIWEGYSQARILWYSHTSRNEFGGNPPDLLPTTRTHLSGQASIDITGVRAAANIQALRKVVDDYSGGVPLETNGESDIDTLSWAKDTASPAGVLSVSLKPRRDYAQLIEPSDVLLVFMSGDKYDVEHLVTLVSVDTVNETRVVDSGTGATVIRVHVNARDMGKILMETPTIFDPSFATIELIDYFPEFTQAFRKPLEGSPSEIVRGILAAYFSVTRSLLGRATVSGALGASVEIDALKQWLFPGHPGASMFSLLDINTFVQQPMVGTRFLPVNILQSAGNLWSLCKMYSNEIVNEFFIDIRDLTEENVNPIARQAVFAGRFLDRWGSFGGASIPFGEDVDSTLIPERHFEEDIEGFKEYIDAGRINNIQAHRKRLTKSPAATVALIHRQLPFDSISFLLLPEHLVFETEVFETNIARSSQEVKNFFRVNLPRLVEGETQGLQFGTDINRWSIQQHGVRRMEAESMYPQLPGFTNYEPMHEYYTQLLSAWNVWNENFLSGTIAIRLRPEIRCGNRLRLVRTTNGQLEIVDFYIQQVSHTYAPQPGASRTTAQVIRGVRRSVGGPSLEEQLFWTDHGRLLPDDPFERVTPKGLVRVDVVEKARPWIRELLASDEDETTVTLPSGGVEPGERDPRGRVVPYNVETGEVGQ